MFSNASDTDGCPHNRANIADIAVGVPAAHIGDLKGARKIACAVEQGKCDDARIGDDVDDAGIAVITKIGFEIGKSCVPVVELLCVIVTDGANDTRVFAGGADVLQADFDQFVGIAFRERGADQCRDKASPFDACAVVRDR